jgi:hypothetical protein
MMVMMMASTPSLKASMRPLLIFNLYEICVPRPTTKLTC